MQNQSCMYLCGHSSVKKFWSCDSRAHNSLSLFQSTKCFQNMFFYQFMHSSESILGVRKNFHSIYPSNVYTHFFSKTSYDQRIFSSNKSWKLSPFTSALFFFYLDTFILIIFFFFLPSFSFLACSLFLFLFFLFQLFIICSFPLSSFFFSLFLSEKVVRTRAHTTYSRLTTR